MGEEEFKRFTETIKTRENNAVIYAAFDTIVNKVLSLCSFAPDQVIKSYTRYSLMFKDVAAIKLLAMLFKDHKDHALYPLFNNWVNGSEWMLT